MSFSLSIRISSVLLDGTRLTDRLMEGDGYRATASLDHVSVPLSMSVSGYKREPILYFPGWTNVTI